jgi:hypothetical protein
MQQYMRKCKHVNIEQQCLAMRLATKFWFSAGTRNGIPAEPSVRTLQRKAKRIHPSSNVLFPQSLHVKYVPVWNRDIYIYIYIYINNAPEDYGNRARVNWTLPSNL